MCHEGQKGQHHEPFQGQEHGQGMSLPCKGQQQEAGAQEGTLNKHVAMEGLKPVRKESFHGLPHLVEVATASAQDPKKERSIPRSVITLSIAGHRDYIADGSEGPPEADNPYKR